LWWEENIGRAQRYYATVLQRQGKAPYQLPPHIAEQIVARQMYSPSMLCVLAIQDWLAMDATLRGKNVAEERVNSPYDSYNVWKYRMGPTVRQLIESTQFNHKLKTMIHHSKR
jgi:4-alpha-glucanotransferase